MRKYLLFFLLFLSGHVYAQDSRIINIEAGELALSLWKGSDGRLYQLGFGNKNSRISVPEKMPARETEWFPCYGNGYIAEPSLQVTHADENTSTDLCYKNHSVIQKENGVSETVISLQDEQYPFFVDVHLLCYDYYNMMEMWTEIRHQEPGEVILYKYASASPLLKAKKYWLTQFNGRYKHEATMEEELLSTGMKTLNSNLGVRAHYYGIPSAILSLECPADEEKGEVFGASLRWSGSYQMTFDLNWSRQLRAIVGINPAGSHYYLSPDSTFRTPSVLWCYSGEGTGKLSRQFHQWAYRYGIRDSQKDRPVLVNNWEATHCDFDEDRLSDLFKEAHTIGAELFLLDDGWFGNGQYARNDDRHGLGDWQEDRSKLPHGLSYLVRKAKSNKIDFGIWLEPEMVNPLSSCYQTHPDWIISQKGREPILGRHQQILDINRPEVFSFEKKIFDDVLGKNKGIAYVKWDCNRFVTQPGSSYLKHSSHLLVDYTWLLYKLMDYFSNNYPNVMGMICAGGSGRVDYGSLPYFHSFWPSDNTDPMDRIKIQWGFSYFFPASTISSHVTRMGKRHLKLAIDVALSGAFGVDLNLTTASKEEKQQLKTATELYKSEIRPLVMHGLLYRLSSPYENSLAALSYVSPDKKKAVLYLYQMKEDSSRSLCLRGLDPSSTYSLREVNKLDDAVKRYEGVYSGRELMEKGLSTLLSHQYESAVIVIEKK